MVDRDDGRDYKRGFDSNAGAKRTIVDEIVAQAPDVDPDRLRRLLRSSRLNDITEYGRVVHAEIVRKTGDGDTVAWEESKARLRTQMLPSSYIERETLAADIPDQLLEQMA